MTPAGAVLDQQAIAISQASGYQLAPALAFDGTNFLVVWADGDIHGARVTPAGTVLDPQGLDISRAAGEQELPALAFDGDNFRVVWQDRRNGDFDIYGRA